MFSSASKNLAALTGLALLTVAQGHTRGCDGFGYITIILTQN